MKKLENFQEFCGVSPMRTCPEDDVLDVFLDMVSIYAAGDDIFLLSVASYTEFKPYIALSIHLKDEAQKEIAHDTADINDSKALNHVSRFRGLGGPYAGKPVHINLTAYWLDPDGSKKTASRPLDATVDSFAAFEKLEVEKPRAANGKQTRVLYGTYTAGASYDYKYPANNKSNQTVKAMLPLDGCLEFKDEWRPQEIDYAPGNNPKLYMLLSSGGAVSYGGEWEKAFSIVDQRVNFSLPTDDWGSKIDVSRLGSSTILDLYFSFTVRVTNDYYPEKKYLARATVISKPITEDEPMVKVAMIEPIYLYWDCLAEDMRISMYPEGEQLISQLKPGDRIMDAEGKGREIALCKALESDRILCVETKSGILLKGTANHMVKTNTGFTRMGDLTSCGYLLKNEPAGSGEVTDEIVSVKEVPYHGLVYHVELADGNTLIVNGVITGDGQIEKNDRCLWKKEVMTARKILRQQVRRLGTDERF